MQSKSYDELIDAANEARLATEDAEAIELYRQALTIGGLRDRARVFGKLKKLDESAADIAESLKLLEASGNKSEFGATLGFGARLKLEQEDVTGALEDFKKSDEILKSADNRHYELYNKLHYAEALVNHGDRAEAEKVLTEAEALIPQYGGEKHTERARELRNKLTTMTK